MQVVVQYFDGCPNWQTAAQRLSELAAELELEISRVKVDTPEEADEVGFRGSPTILVNGRDPFATGAEPGGLACRMYPTPDGPQGSPTIEQLRKVLA